MREWRDNAIILRMGLFGEAHLWLRMLCQNRGLLTVFAFGGAKSRKRFCGCLDVFNSLDCHVKSTRQGSFLNLLEATLLDGTRALRQNWQNMGIAANCLRFMEALPIGPEGAPECYQTLGDLRTCLEHEPKPHRLMPLFFRLRIAAALGFAPDFKICAACGATVKGGGLFLADEGRVYCNSCSSEKKPESGYAIHMSAPGLDALHTAQKQQPAAWLGISLSSAESGSCARLVDAFVQYHLGLAWDNGFFRHV